MTSRKQTQVQPSAPRTKELEPLLTMADVQRILQLSKPKIYQLMRTHALPSLKIDGARRFEPGTLQAWIEEQSDAW